LLTFSQHYGNQSRSPAASKAAKQVSPGGARMFGCVAVLIVGFGVLGMQRVELIHVADEVQSAISK
jgi:hypothetical protein